jgi:hypothetical protein
VFIVELGLQDGFSSFCDLVLVDTDLFVFAAFFLKEGYFLIEPFDLLSVLLDELIMIRRISFECILWYISKSFLKFFLYF